MKPYDSFIQAISVVPLQQHMTLQTKGIEFTNKPPKTTPATSYLSNLIPLFLYMKHLEVAASTCPES